MAELTDVQQDIFNKVKENWEERVGKGNVDEDALRDLITMADKHGDGNKRITVENKGTYLVPIEDIILIGVDAADIEKKYPKIE